MNRREWLGAAASAVLLQGHVPATAWAARKRKPIDNRFVRVRPGTPGWPGAREWHALRTGLDGRLLAVESPFARGAKPDARTEALAGIKNPFYIGDHPALTQTSGWQDAALRAPASMRWRRTTPATSRRPSVSRTATGRAWW